jgi:rhodanese-related sulfurtransferase
LLELNEGTAMSKRMMITTVGSVILLSALYLFAQDKDILISPSDTFKLLQGDSTIIVLDVRTPAEFKSETGHLAHALLLPVQELERRVDELQNYQQKLIIVYCRTGHRSTTATDILQKHGHNVRNMEGGITRWRAERFPVEKENQ